MPKINKCNLCGAEFPEDKQCKDLYYELAFYTLSKRDKEFIHQYAVDAYGAQHITKNSKEITVGATLIGLFLLAEHNYSGREIQQAHIKLGNKMRDLKIVNLPKEMAKYNVLNVLNIKEGKERDAMIKQWALSVWDIWKAEHSIIRNFVNHQNIL
jgi:hypothetical protein